jgi:3-hydroxyisobutyrate dehydrogenase
MNTKIGWIGLGRMGIPMSQRLLNGGYPVTVYNRSKGKEEILLSRGATVALSPAQLMEQADVIVIMVSNDQAIRDIFAGNNSLLSSGIGGKIVINMSTVSPGISKEMAELCRQLGNHYLDAPVSGSVKQAESGGLVVMVGGEDAVFQEVKPILDQLGKLSIRVGDNGAGNITKLAVNTLLGIMSQGLSETILFARENGIETQDLLTVIHNSAMGNVYMKIKGDAILQNNFQAAFALKHIAKDLRLAKECGLNTPIGETAYKTFQEAEIDFGEEDIIAVIKKIENTLSSKIENQSSPEN